MSEAEIEKFEVEVEGDKPRFVLVELSQLEKILQRCFECGKAPRAGKSRNIKWTKNGTNLTATYTCSCKNNQRIRWATQDYIPGTKTRNGNLAIVAASQVAPISYPELHSLFYSAGIASLSNTQFKDLSRWYVWPAVEEEYTMHHAHIIESLPDQIDVALDGQYDSPGFSAELCAVSAVESSSKQVVDFSVVHKSETQDISGRMELEGVKRCLSSIEHSKPVNRITVDKHPQVVAYLQTQEKEVCFDPWHRLKSLKKELKKSIKEFTDCDNKKQMQELARRFMVHLWSSIERSNGDAKICQELVFSFFLHIQGIHRWTRKRKFGEFIQSGGVDVCKRFKKEEFEIVIECPHITEATHPDSRHDSISPDSKFYKLILASVSKTAFMNDLDKMKIENITSYVENFHSVSIKYRPKRKYFTKRGFERRTMLAVLAYNENRAAEMRGERRITGEYPSFSKAKGEMVTKVKKGPPCEEWKKAIVRKSFEMKRQFGTGNPSNSEQEEEPDEVDLVINKMDELLLFNDSDGEFDE